MSKIICDVCGTSYAETLTQCPICGCVRSVDVRTVSESEDDELQSAHTGGYNHVKGGRFSKSNVKKRQNSRTYHSQVEDDQEQESEKKADKGLLIAFIVLLLSVAAVVCYIIIKFFSPDLLNPNSGKDPAPGYVDNDPVISTDAAQEGVACEDIAISQTSVTLSQINETFQLEVTLTPEDTEDELVYASSDENVVTVSADGLLTAVGAGEATITVSCGNIEKTLSVSCNFQSEDPTLPSVPTVDLPVTPAGFELNRSDFSMFKKGETWTLYNGSIPDSEITWTSSNPKVATVTNGTVTAVSAGRAVITARYKDSELQCTVYCKDSVGSYVEPENPGDQDDADDNEQPTQNRYKLNTANRKNDITIYVGKSYTIKLLDENGQQVDAAFTSSNSGVCSVSADGVVTGKAKGKVNITVTFGGETHVCIVRVRAN